MHILMTGSTTPQCNALKRITIEKIDVPRQIVRQMEDLGHEVDWRAPDIGEDLRQYDFMWVNIASAVSINSPYTLTALWSVSQAVEHDIPLILFFDDWQFLLTTGGMRGFVKIGYRQITKTIGGAYMYRGDLEKANEHRVAIFNAAQWIGNSQHPFWDLVTAVIPKYRGFGDKTIVENLLGLPVLEYDPSNLAYDVVRRQEDETNGIQVDFNEREKAWTLAALIAHEKWVDKLNLQWPVKYFGARKMKAPRLKREEDIYAAYGQAQGALAPPYYHDGSGWFRSRYVYSSSAGNVLVCGPKDGAAIGPAFTVSARKIEELSDEVRQMLALEQMNQFLDKGVSTYEMSRRQIEDILISAQVKHDNV